MFVWWVVVQSDGSEEGSEAEVERGFSSLGRSGEESVDALWLSCFWIFVEVRRVLVIRRRRLVSSWTESRESWRHSWGRMGAGYSDFGHEKFHRPARQWFRGGPTHLHVR